MIRCYRSQWMNYLITNHDMTSEKEWSLLEKSVNEELNIHLYGTEEDIRKSEEEGLNNLVNLIL